MKKLVTFFLLFSLIIIPFVWADDVDNVWAAANSNVYGTKLGGMLGRGVLNAVTCFVDLIVHVVEGSQQGPPVVGTLTGLGSGIGCTVLRAGSGVLDIATSWVPGFNGFPVSRSYSNCILSEEEKQEVKPQEPVALPPAPAPAPRPEDYAKPAAPARHHDAYDYVKK